MRCVTIYESDYWTLINKDKARLIALEMWCWCRLITTVTRRRGSWIGHLLQHSSRCIALIEEKEEHKVERGIPRTVQVKRL